MPPSQAILAGTNNIGASSSPNSAAIISDLTTMVNAATGDGSRVILCTLLPRNATVGVPLSAGQITADGIVVHTLRVGQTKSPSVSGMGIRFSELESSSKQLLETYLQVQNGAAPP